MYSGAYPRYEKAPLRCNINRATCSARLLLDSARTGSREEPRRAEHPGDACACGQRKPRDRKEGERRHEPRRHLEQLRAVQTRPKSQGKKKRRRERNRNSPGRDSRRVRASLAEASGSCQPGADKSPRKKGDASKYTGFTRPPLYFGQAPVFEPRPPPARTEKRKETALGSAAGQRCNQSPMATGIQTSGRCRRGRWLTPGPRLSLCVYVCRRE